MPQSLSLVIKCPKKQEENRKLFADTHDAGYQETRHQQDLMNTAPNKVHPLEDRLLPRLHDLIPFGGAAVPAIPFGIDILGEKGTELFL